MSDARNFHVVTGGPGGGKTTLLERLSALGLRSMPEAGRGVIRAELASGGNALPWGDRVGFAARMAEWELRSHAEALDATGPVFFDRGLPDTLGYCRLEGIDAPPGLEAAARRIRYAQPVFLAPFWPEIYRQDAERKQTAELAERTAAVIAETWRELGYALVELPKADIETRVRFVLEAIAAGRSFPVVGRCGLH